MARHCIGVPRQLDQQDFEHDAAAARGSDVAEGINNECRILLWDPGLHQDGLEACVVRRVPPALVHHSERADGSPTLDHCVKCGVRLVPPLAGPLDRRQAMALAAALDGRVDRAKTSKFGGR